MKQVLLKTIVIVIGKLTKVVEFYEVGRVFVGPQGERMGQENFTSYARGTRQEWGKTKL